MSYSNVPCPECSGKDQYCPACDGTNQVYITSVDSHLNAISRYSEVYLALESAVAFVHNFMPESENKTSFMDYAAKVLHYDMRELKGR